MFEPTDLLLRALCSWLGKPQNKVIFFSGHSEVQFQRDFSGCFLDKNRIQLRAFSNFGRGSKQKNPDPDPNKISGPGSVTLDTAPCGKIYVWYVDCWSLRLLILLYIFPFILVFFIWHIVRVEQQKRIDKSMYFFWRSMKKFDFLTDFLRNVLITRKTHFCAV